MKSAAFAIMYGLLAVPLPLDAPVKLPVADAVSENAGIMASAIDNMTVKLTILFFILHSSVTL